MEDIFFSSTSWRLSGMKLCWQFFRETSIGLLVENLRNCWRQFVSHLFCYCSISRSLPYIRIRELIINLMSYFVLRNKRHEAFCWIILNEYANWFCVIVFWEILRLVDVLRYTCLQDPLIVATTLLFESSRIKIDLVLFTGVDLLGCRFLLSFALCIEIIKNIN